MDLNSLIHQLENIRDNMHVGETEVTFYCRETDNTYVVDAVGYDVAYGLIELREE